MKARNLIAALVVFTLISIAARAQESLVTYKSLSTELALDLARAALADCQRRGYQVAVAVVDRFGITQVLNAIDRPARIRARRMTAKC